MPAMPKDMSWLSPKRRKTTGNLKTVGSVQIPNGSDPPSSPPLQSPTTPTPDKRPKSARPMSQPPFRRAISSAGPSNGMDSGNLFYAYARKSDDLKSRYLLTFASATVANEWWLHVQQNFPDTTRPGPQLFSFKTDDLLDRAWRHPAFEHLKSKWMYIAFSDATGDIGGAAQGIIPVQDAEGNMLGSGAGRESIVAGEMKKEAKEVRNEVQRLEEHFEKMMKDVEKNTEKVAELAGQRAEGSTDYIGAPEVSTEGSGITYFDMDVLSGHFGRMNDLLAKNNEHIDGLVRKHDEHEEQLRSTIQVLASQQKNDHLDMRQLSTHLDKIQQVLETSLTERKDSAKDMSERPPQIDLSPLTDKLEQVQEAFEQNSALMRTLLDESAGASDSKPGTLFWGKDQASINLLPLTEHLERIHKVIEQQNEHTKALASLAGADREAPDGKQPTSLAPLVAEHLEQIYNAVEEGNKHAAGSRDDIQKLLESQEATREAIVANGGEIDFTPMAEHLESIRESSNTNAETIKSLLETQQATHKDLDLSPLFEQLGAIHSATEQNSSHVRELISSHQNSSKSDFTPVTNSLKKIQSTLEKQASDRRDASPGTGDSKFLMNALSSHLSKIQALTEQNAAHVKSLHEKQPASQDKMHIAVSETSEQVRALVGFQGSQQERIAENEKRLEAQSAQMREMMSGQREMVEVMRSLAKSVTAQSKGACDHVVVPPPRKMGRKVVGFVYDAKENGA